MAALQNGQPSVRKRGFVLSILSLLFLLRIQYIIYSCFCNFIFFGILLDVLDLVFLILIVAFFLLTRKNPTTRKMFHSPVPLLAKKSYWEYFEMPLDTCFSCFCLLWVPHITSVDITTICNSYPFRQSFSFFNFLLHFVLYMLYYTCVEEVRFSLSPFYPFPCQNLPCSVMTQKKKQQYAGLKKLLFFFIFFLSFSAIYAILYMLMPNDSSHIATKVVSLIPLLYERGCQYGGSLFLL